MKELTSLNTKKDSKKTAASTLFLCALVILIFSPFAGITSMIGMVGDTCIQIRIGLDDLAQGRLITDEIYSWHEGLVFTAHESGWYLLLGIMYKLMKLWGVILVGTAFIYATGFTAVSYFKDKANPFVAAAVMAVTPMLGGFPDYNVRPAVTSIFMVTLLIVTCIGERKALHKCIVFAVCAFFLGWLQGGILPLFFVVFIVFIAVELVFRNFKEAGFMAAGAAAGFVLSLLNPMGIRAYLFGLKQSGASDIWAMVDEWNPMRFNLFQITIILVVFIGFMAGDGLRKFDKKAITKLLLLCMFFIMTCVYKRFVVYYSVAFLLFAPELMTDLISWFVANVIKSKKEIKFKLSDMFYKVLAGGCVVMTVVLGYVLIPMFLPTGTMADIEAMAAYDPQAVEFIKEQGYEKIFNSFDTGSWLAFHGVKVHIDNRIDPFMSEFSGEDHIRGQMGITSLADLDAFRTRYDNDAFLINTGEGYPYFLYEIDTYAADRYAVVYDNVVPSSIPGVSNQQWIIIECR